MNMAMHAIAEWWRVQRRPTRVTEAAIDCALTGLATALICAGILALSALA